MDIFSHPLPHSVPTDNVLEPGGAAPQLERARSAAEAACLPSTAETQRRTGHVPSVLYRKLKSVLAVTGATVDQSIPRNNTFTDGAADVRGCGQQAAASASGRWYNSFPCLPAGRRAFLLPVVYAPAGNNQRMKLVWPALGC